jgi:putative ABC transport system permease protein
MRASALHETLKAAAGRTTGTAMANRFRAALVISELALALVLLIGSGLMVKAFWKLTEVNSGIDSKNLLTLRFSLPASQYRDAAAIVNFQQALISRVESLPGVAAAALVSGLPPVRPINANTTAIEGAVSSAVRTPAGQGPNSGTQFDEIDYYNLVGMRYFDTVGARLLDGRLFQQGDGASANPVVVVNQTMARKYWPNGSAVGHRIRNGPPNTPWRTIVGVVSDIKNAGLDRPSGTELYFPTTQIPPRLAYLFVKTRADPLSAANAIRAEMRALDRALPISDLRTMEDVLDSARARPRFVTLVLTLFSSIALLLAALGIYGVISYSVAQRTSEIGIRMALGAQSGDVLKLVGWTGLRFAIAGTVLGAFGAFALTRTMSGLLFGVSSFDAGTFAAMAAALIAVTMVACWIPARRASKVDPLVALRYE